MDLLCAGGAGTPGYTVLCCLAKEANLKGRGRAGHLHTDGAFHRIFRYRKWNLLVGVLHPASKTLPKPQLLLQAASSPAGKPSSVLRACS